MVGAALVLPGRRLDGASLHELMTTERVTMAAGVPTVWLGLLSTCAAAATGSRRERILVGGAACPQR